MQEAAAGCHGCTAPLCSAGCLPALTDAEQKAHLCLPDAWSIGMLTSLMSPKGMKAACSVDSFTLSSRPPTYSVVLGLVPLPCTATRVDSMPRQLAGLEGAEALLRLLAQRALCAVG